MSARQLASLAATLAVAMAVAVGSVVGARSGPAQERLLPGDPVRLVLDEAASTGLAQGHPSSVRLDVAEGVVITVEPARPLVAEPRQTG